MCRSIKPLFNLQPAASDADIAAASLQFVRKISGFSHPSKVNEKAFNRAGKDIARVSRRLLESLETAAEPRDRARVDAAARARRQKS